MIKYINSFFGWIQVVRERIEEVRYQEWLENPDPRSRLFLG